MKQSDLNPQPYSQIREDMRQDANRVTIQDLFEEYANNYSRIYELLLKNENSTLIRRFRNENEQIIQEVEALVRKETIEEIISLGKPKDDRFVSKIIYTHQIKEYAQSKEITMTCTHDKTLWCDNCKNIKSMKVYYWGIMDNRQKCHHFFYDRGMDAKIMFQI